MKILDKWLQNYFAEELPSADKLADLFTFHSFEIEGVEDVEAGKVIDAKILPDRAHFCLSYSGIAEEVEVLTGLKRIPKINTEISIDDSLGKVEVKIEDTNFCRRYVSRRVNGLNITESPEASNKWLEAMDGRAINKIVDSTNLAMFDIGQPLHAFDADKVKGDIVVRAAKEGEKIILLNDTEVELSSNDFVIADDEGPLAIAGVKGGKRAEVTMQTKNIILESANFHPSSVRKTAVKYNLRNESSKRFENEITPEFAMSGMEHVSIIIKELSPEAVFGPISDIYPNPVSKNTISVSLEFINKKLGIDIPKDEVLRILKALSIEVKEGDILELTIPYHRLDLVIKEDIVEEVGRIYGYDKIEGKKALANAGEAVADQAFYATEKIKNILVGMGFSEAYLYTFTSKGDMEVAYPLASDKKALRTNLSDGMKNALEANTRNADFLFLDSLKIFEIGKVFTEKGEHTSLCVGIKRIKKVKGSTVNDDIRDTREHLLEALGANVITACTIDDTGGILLLKGKQIGEINKIDGIMELNLDTLVNEVSGVKYEEIGFGPSPAVKYAPFSPYPFIVRDIAVFVPESVTSEEVLGVISENAGPLFLRNNLFDTFKKDGKVSYAFRLIFQSFERTLTDDDVSGPISKITESMLSRNWEVR